MRVYTFDRRQLKKEHREKWAAGLLSGKYAQIKNGMCDANKPNSACCLHVAAIELDKACWEDGINHNGCRHYIPTQLYVDTSISSICQGLVFALNGHHSGLSASLLNDDENLTFSQIAELITTGRLEVAS